MTARDRKRTFDGQIGHMITCAFRRLKGTAGPSSNGFDNRRYVGLPRDSRPTLAMWLRSNTTYRRLHQAWVDADYARALMPTLDRRSTNRGYILGNLRVVTYQANLQDAGRRGAAARRRQLKAA